MIFYKIHRNRTKIRKKTFQTKGGGWAGHWINPSGSAALIDTNAHITPSPSMCSGICLTLRVRCQGARPGWLLNVLARCRRQGRDQEVVTAGHFLGDWRAAQGDSWISCYLLLLPRPPPNGSAPVCVRACVCAEGTANSAQPAARPVPLPVSRLGPATLSALHGGKLPPAESPERPAPSCRGSGTRHDGSRRISGSADSLARPGGRGAGEPVQPSPAHPRTRYGRGSGGGGSSRGWPRRRQTRTGRPCPCPCRCRPAALPRQGRRCPPASRPPPAAAAALTQAELGDIGVVGPAEDAGDEEHRHPVEQPLAAPPHAAPSARRPGCRRRRRRHLPAPHPAARSGGPGPGRAPRRSPPRPHPPGAAAPPTARPPLPPGWAGPGSGGRAAREPVASPRGPGVCAGPGTRTRTRTRAAGSGRWRSGPARRRARLRPPRAGALGRAVPWARRCCLIIRLW